MNPHDAETIRATAGYALRLVRLGNTPVGANIASNVFRLGLGYVEVMVKHWASLAALAIDTAGQPLPTTGPFWPTNNGGIVTDIRHVTPAELWAGRYIAAIRAGDLSMAHDLYLSCTAHQLAEAAEALMTLAARWTNRTEGSNR